jgi:hypothetical protein
VSAALTREQGGFGCERDAIRILSGMVTCSLPFRPGGMRLGVRIIKLNLA